MSEKIKLSKGIFIEIEGDNSILYISDNVEMYDNDDFYDEIREHHVKNVYIGKNLKEIRGSIPFGMHVKDIFADKENKYYTSLQGVLFSNDGKRLVLYPAGREDSYEIPEGTEYIDKFAFYMESFPAEIKIPSTVTNIDNAAFNEIEDKGFGMSKEDIMCMTTLYCPEELKEQISVIWNEKTYQKPAVVYYGEGSRVSFRGEEYRDIKELCERYGLRVGKVCYYVEQYLITLEKAVEYCLEENTPIVIKVNDTSGVFTGIMHISDLLGVSVKDIRKEMIEEKISFKEYMKRVIEDVDLESFESDISRIGKRLGEVEPENAITYTI